MSNLSKFDTNGLIEKRFRMARGEIVRGFYTYDWPMGKGTVNEEFTGAWKVKKSYIQYGDKPRLTLTFVRFTEGYGWDYKSKLCFEYELSWLMIRLISAIVWFVSWFFQNAQEDSYWCQRATDEDTQRKPL